MIGLALLRLGELAAFLLLVAWTVVFPLATLLSLLITAPTALLVRQRAHARAMSRASPA